MRRLPTGFGIAVLVGAVVAALVALATPVAARPRATSTEHFVDVVKVSGYLDPVLVSFVEQSISSAEAERSIAIVLQLDSQGVVVSAGKLAALTKRISSATIPVGVWVGPSGATAGGKAGELVDAARYAAVSPGSTVTLRGHRFGATDALHDHIADFAAPTLGDFIVNLPGVKTKQVERNGQPRLEPVSPVRFSGLTILDQLLHTVGSPAVAYLMFVIGLGLILFEFFTAGVGVAGVVGAGSFVLGCYGLVVLPTNGVAVGLLVLAMFGFSIDVQTGVPRVWTGIGTVAFVVGSITLYGGGIRLSWITLLVSIVGMVVAMLAGMPAMVRSRFSTPTIGREWMIGETGVALRSVDPDGVVTVRDAPWRARTNRATPIPAGAGVRVSAIDGLVLEVEPLEGAAKDYRH